MSKVYVMMIAMLAAAGSVFAANVYVDANLTTGANDGSSWANALLTLQDALARAGLGGEIRVAQGVYTPDRGLGVARGDREATFRLASGLTLRGGYAGGEAPDPGARDPEVYVTVLSGDLQAKVCLGLGGVSAHAFNLGKVFGFAVNPYPHAIL